MAASKVVAVVNMLQQVFYFSFQLNISREYEDKNISNFLSNTYKAYSAILLVIGSIVISISGILAFVVLKGEFYIARIYLPLAMFGALIDCVFCFFKSLYSSYLKTGRLLISFVISAVINVSLYCILIPKYRIWGVFISYTISNAIAAVIRVIDTEKFVHVDKFWKRV